MDSISMVSADILRSMGACREAVERFVELFGKGAVDVSYVNIAKAEREGMDTAWLVMRRLDTRRGRNFLRIELMAARMRFVQRVVAIAESPVTHDNTLDSARDEWRHERALAVWSALVMDGELLRSPVTSPRE